METKYLLLTEKKILRLDPHEQTPEHFQQLKPYLLDGDEVHLSQDEANWRVVIFRDEIIEWSEFSDR